MVLEAIQEGNDQGLVWEDLIPRGDIQVRRNDGRHPSIAAVHQTEEGVGLFGFQGQVAKLVDFG